MLQIANTVLADTKDKTEITILGCNSTPEDVMLYSAINRIEAESGGQIKVTWAVSKDRAAPPSATDPDEAVPYPWPHATGRISAALLREHLPDPGPDAIACLCGPPGFNEAAQAALVEVGYDRVLTW
jgi:ferredoxin-NADP reductase